MVYWTLHSVVKLTDFADVREEGKQLYCTESGWSQNSA